MRDNEWSKARWEGFDKFIPVKAEVETSGDIFDAIARSEAAAAAAADEPATADAETATTAAEAEPAKNNKPLRGKFSNDIKADKLFKGSKTVKPFKSSRLPSIPKLARLPKSGKSETQPNQSVTNPVHTIPESTEKIQRDGPDIILRLIDILSVVLWGFIIVNLMLILMAKPIAETFFDRLLDIVVIPVWNVGLLTFALKLTLVQFFISIVSLVLNALRLKRKDDKVRISLVLSTFVSLFMCVGLIMFLYF